MPVCCCSFATRPVWRNNGFTGLLRCWVFLSPPPAPAPACLWPRFAAVADPVAGRGAGAESLAGSSPRCVTPKPTDVLRVRPARLRCWCGRCRRCSAVWRGVMSRRSGSSTPAKCRRPTPSRPPSGWRSAARHPDWPGAWRRIGQRCSIFTVAMPEYWQLFLGLIFIIVTLFYPRGDGPAASRRPLMQPDEGLFPASCPVIAFANKPIRCCSWRTSTSALTVSGR